MSYSANYLWFWMCWSQTILLTPGTFCSGGNESVVVIHRLEVCVSPCVCANLPVGVRANNLSWSQTTADSPELNNDSLAMNSLYYEPRSQSQRMLTGSVCACLNYGDIGELAGLKCHTAVRQCDTHNSSLPRPHRPTGMTTKISLHNTHTHTVNHLAGSG